jgi:hypothetical protein
MDGQEIFTKPAAMKTYSDDARDDVYMSERLQDTLSQFHRRGMGVATDKRRSGYLRGDMTFGEDHNESYAKETSEHEQPEQIFTSRGLSEYGRWESDKMSSSSLDTKDRQLSPQHASPHKWR